MLILSMYIYLVS